jgi:hypothetical protein
MAIGQYHFHRLRSHWGIWVVESISNDVTMSQFVKDAYSYQEALCETYRLNGWGTPKNINKKY